MARQRVTEPERGYGPVLRWVQTAQHALAAVKDEVADL